MRKHVLLPALAVAAVGAVPVTASAEATANIGWVSDYIFRGIYQEDSSAYAGVDLNHDTGFYIGAWGADVGTGNEIDYYLGWGGSRDDFSYSVGYTFYTYPDNFDEKYEEINLGFGWRFLQLDMAIGKYKNVDAVQTLQGAGLAIAGSSVKYTFTSLTIKPEMGPHFKVGIWGDDLEELLVWNGDPARFGKDAAFVEIGYTYTMEDFGVDLSVALTVSDSKKFAGLANFADGDGPADFALTFGISKSFTLDD